MEVSIYIAVYHTGHLKHGTGTYAAVLEYISSKGKPATLYLIKGVKGTTSNRTALLACIESFKRLKKECKVKVMINSRHITEAINSNAYLEWIRTGLNAKKKPVINLELWKQLDQVMEKHTFEFKFTEHTPYTSWMLHEVKNREIEYMEDEENV
jgi:Ribonuclease HI